MITVSTITPVYKGEDYLEDLVKKIEEVKNEWSIKYKNIQLIESIFVIDDAKDNSLQIINKLAAERNWIRVIELSRNYGQHPATIAGILHSSGTWISTLDEDLQHDPAFIVKMMEKALENSLDICYASPSEKTHNSFIRDQVSISFKKIISLLSGVKHIKYFNSFRVVRGSIARASAAIASHDTYYDIVLSWFTNRVTTVKLPLRDLRNLSIQNQSGYSFFSLVAHGKRMIMTSKIKLLRVGMLFGLLAFITSIFITGYALYSQFYASDSVFIQGWASTIVTILFFGGLTSLLLGFNLESISDILLNSKGKPTFFIVDRSGDTSIIRKNENSEQGN